jgi:meso-butanediol dehydrogenase / (S,S)-butanediol dehydrogenase / diacetyl reductase
VTEARSSSGQTLAKVAIFSGLAESELAFLAQRAVPRRYTAGEIVILANVGIPEIKKRGGGSIINLASVQGYACQRGVVAYAASKGAILSLTRALALDHAADNIRVNSISPGSIRTPMLARSAAHFVPGQSAEETFVQFGAAHPLGRIGTPEEVAELAAFLAPDKAGFCTGADYLVDGGLLAGIDV